MSLIANKVIVSLPREAYWMILSHHKDSFFDNTPLSLS